MLLAVFSNYNVSCYFIHLNFKSFFIFKQQKKLGADDTRKLYSSFKNAGQDNSRFHFKSTKKMQVLFVRGGRKATANGSGLGVRRGIH